MNGKIKVLLYKCVVSHGSISKPCRETSELRFERQKICGEHYSSTKARQQTDNDHGLLVITVHKTTQARAYCS